MDDLVHAVPVAVTRRASNLDRLAGVALVLALVPMPLLGVGHPLTHVLTISAVIAFGWLLVHPGRSPSRAVRELHLRWPGRRRGWVWVVIAGIASGVLRLWVDQRLLAGQGGLKFYDTLLRQYGVIGDNSGGHWIPFLACTLMLLPVILVDGVFFSGLLQGRLTAHTNAHAGVLIQALLFALPHTFAGPVPDIAYGIGTFLGGVAYGYLYRFYENHWIPASLLWLHVATVWAIMVGRI